MVQETILKIKKTKNQIIIHLRLGRVSNLPTVFTNVFLGNILANLKIEVFSLFISLLAGSFAYIGGMYLNDACDRNWDLAHLKNRPIALGQISYQKVFFFAILFLGLSLLFFYIANLSFGGGINIFNAISPILLIGSIIFYNFCHKKNNLSPLLMASCRVLLICSSYFSRGGENISVIIPLGASLFIYIIGLTYIAKFEMKKKRTPRRVMEFFLIGSPFVLGAVILDLLFSHVVFLIFVLAWIFYCLKILRKGILRF